MHVIIIGAGTGGMALAHGLKNAGVSVAVYERDRTRGDGLHGYRVGIDPDGARALQECLPARLFDTFIATCARAPRHFNAYTEKLTELVSLDLPQNTDPANSEHSVSRMTLRQVLLSGMDDVVHYGRTFERYTTDGSSVTAHFTDGTTATGDVLVGADGANSPVRRQYLPHVTVRDSGVVAIAAKLPSTPQTRALLPKEALTGVSMLLAPRGSFMILHSMEFPWDAEGTVKDGIGGSDRELIENWPGLLYDNTRDYLNWGLSASADKFPADVTRMRGKDLVRLALGMTEKWSPDLRELIGHSDPGSCFALRIRTTDPVEPWTPTRVTLLGDAIHTMTPGKGVGANTALRDAVLLKRALTGAGTDVVKAIGAYEAEMLPYGMRRVKESLAQYGLNGRDLVHKPVIGRVLLAVNRTFFRVVNRVPALKRKFLAAMSADRGMVAEDR
ncbi:monooxygenase [Actinorhabdospora filicis]|uniref:Monooxygenase n=1 Tax=Actinorhabdospora filicis TaxID=1785913 RepID=A0A9W6SRW8_9ACTN|nr:NAD(P)/FAD-dependent oxidoreductase [Actinorhabdospora filicis]GLZ81132.1 monooxygenase [Actinorhabdospora filicis]